MIDESHPFLSLSIRNAPFTQRWTTWSKICAWWVSRILSNKIKPLSLNGTMNNVEPPLQGKHYSRKMPKWPNDSKRITEKVPLLPKPAKNIPFSLICSDLSLPLKKAPFSDNSWPRMLTHILNVVPPRLRVALTPIQLSPHVIQMIICL